MTIIAHENGDCRTHADYDGVNLATAVKMLDSAAKSVAARCGGSVIACRSVVDGIVQHDREIVGADGRRIVLRLACGG